MTERILPADLYDLDAKAALALDEARDMPAGPERTEALKKAGMETELLIFKGAGHYDQEFRTQITATENRDKTVKFFDKHLKTKS